MKLVVISDTHGYKPALPHGDILVHCGDMTAYGTEEETRKYLTWISEQPFQFKIVVPGNHDLWLYEQYRKVRTPEDPFRMGWVALQTWLVDIGDVHLLVDEGRLLDPKLTICNGKRYSFYGSPWTPMFNNWAFMDDDKNLHKHFQRIPEGVDVLITHGPAYGILDKPSAQQRSQGDTRLGSQSLLYHIMRAKPKVHVHGHIHASYGMYPQYGESDTTHYNCAIMGEDYKPTHQPVEIEI